MAEAEFVLVITEITYGVYLGDHKDALNIGSMIRNGIMTVVSLSGEKPVEPIPGFGSINLQFKNLDQLSHWRSDLVKWMTQSQKRGAVIVCSKDPNEAVIIVWMYLLQQEEMSLEDIRSCFKSANVEYDDAVVVETLARWGVLQ